MNKSNLLWLFTINGSTEYDPCIGSWVKEYEQEYPTLAIHNTWVNRIWPMHWVMGKGIWTRVPYSGYSQYMGQQNMTYVLGHESRNMNKSTLLWLFTIHGSTEYDPCIESWVKEYEQEISEQCPYLSPQWLLSQRLNKTSKVCTNTKENIFLNKICVS